MRGKNTLMRFILRVVAALVLLLSADAVIAETQIYGLIGTGKVDSDVEPSDLDLGNDFQVGGGLNVLGGEGFKAGLGVEVNYFTGSDSFEDLELNIDSTITTLNFVVEAAGPIRPFVSAGIGFANSSLSGTEERLGLEIDGDDFSLAYGVGGGVKFVAGEVLFVGGDFHYFRVQADPEQVKAYRLAGVLGAKF